MEEIKRNLIVCGDIHGKLRELVHKVVEDYDIKNASIIICGDFGAGFEKKGYLDNEYSRCKNRLEENDITLYAIRGNHDDPEYFRNPSKYNYPRLIFLEDHHVYEIEGRTIYTIGGANSIDYVWRIDWNNDPEHKKAGKKVWWEDEDVVKVPVDHLITNKTDIIVSHEAPLSFSPIISRPDNLDAAQYSKILNTRTYLNEILKSIDTDYWFYGHYHTHYSGSYNKTVWRCLDELELFQVPDKIKEKEDNNG